MITARTMQRLELWSGIECAGGARLAILGGLTAAKANVSLAGDDKLTVILPIDHVQRDAITFWRVLRVVESDAVYDEWVISDRTAAESDATLTVTAQPAEQYLGRTTLVGMVDGLGNVVYDISDLGLTPHDHLASRLLPWLAAQGIAWVELGTVEPTVTIDMTLAWDGPLAYLQRLASTASAEFQFRRVDAAHYAIDLLTKIGSTAPVADFRRRKNLQGLTEAGTAAEQVTRVFPRGAQGDAGYASMATALWQVTAIAGNVVTLADPAAGAGPILEDGQLDGLYLRRPDGTYVAVVASDAAAQTVTLAAAPACAVGDYVAFVLDATGTALTYLDSPNDIAAAGGAPQGVIAGVLDVPDVVATANLVPNPAGRLWGGALPDGWATVGAPTSVTKQTVGPYVQAAGVSLHVVATHDGDGVVSPAAPVRPSSATPYGSGFAVLWVLSGQVRVELVVTDSDGGQTVLPVSPAVASSTVLGQWDSLGVAGEDLNAIDAVSVAVRVVQHGATAAEFYVDGAQVTQTAEQDPFLEGTGGTRLWQAANERLRAKGAPARTYSSEILDRARLDPATYGADSALVLGGTVRVTDDAVLSGVVLTRVVSLERDYLDVGNGSFTLSTLPDDLGGALARPATPPRPTSPVTAPVNADADTQFENVRIVDHLATADVVFAAGARILAVLAFSLIVPSGSGNDIWSVPTDSDIADPSVIRVLKSTPQVFARDVASITFNKTPSGSELAIRLEARDGQGRLTDFRNITIPAAAFSAVPYVTGNDSMAVDVVDPAGVLDPAGRITFNVTPDGGATTRMPATSMTSVTVDGVTTYTYALTGIPLLPKHNTTVQPLQMPADGTDPIPLAAYGFDPNTIADVRTAAVAYVGPNAVVSMATDTDAVVGATGAQYSTDAGATWTNVTVDASYHVAFTIARDPENPINLLLRGVNAAGEPGPTVPLQIAAYIAEGPSISATGTISVTQVSIAWSGVGLILLSIDGGTPATPSASPIIVTRDAQPHAYLFTATQASVTQPCTVIVPPLGPGGLGGPLGTADVGAGTLTVTWSDALPVGVTRTVDWSVDGGASGRVDAASSPEVISTPLSGSPSGTVVITATDSNGVVLAQVQRSGPFAT